MMLHPEAQQKAQAELDEVVGKNELPTYSDVEKLPYVGALVAECFRSLPVTPIGLFLALEALRWPLSDRQSMV